MTNLTDEGLRSGVKEIVHIKRLGCVDPIEDLIFSFAKQVRDAAKKETKEKAAVVAENYLVTNKQYAGVATAIRQMDGGK